MARGRPTEVRAARDCLLMPDRATYCWVPAHSLAARPQPPGRRPLPADRVLTAPLDLQCSAHTHPPPPTAGKAKKAAAAEEADGAVAERGSYDVDEHMLSPREVAERFGTTIDWGGIGASQGLTTEEVKEKQQEFGLNRLTPPKERSELVKFLLQVSRESR
jgi:hypothetical protein